MYHRYVQGNKSRGCTAVTKEQESMNLLRTNILYSIMGLLSHQILDYVLMCIVAARGGTSVSEDGVRTIIILTTCRGRERDTRGPDLVSRGGI